MEVSGQLHAPVTFPQGKSYWYPGWVSPRAILYAVVKIKEVTFVLSFMSCSEGYKASCILRLSTRLPVSHFGFLYPGNNLIRAKLFHRNVLDGEIKGIIHGT
jgi:hypothetical protein